AWPPRLRSSTRACGCILRIPPNTPLEPYHVLTAANVLVPIGTPCSRSAVGSAETYRARVARSPDFIAYAAFDAGLVDLEPQADGSLKITWRNGEPATIDEIEQRHGAQLRANLGI